MDLPRWSVAGGSRGASTADKTGIDGRPGGVKVFGVSEREKKPAANFIRAVRFPALLMLLIAAVWAFPKVWFRAPQFAGVWLEGATEVAGWSYRAVPISETAERLLTSDAASSGQFDRANGERVTVFLASRSSQVENDLQLFAHPPDLCWTQAGFQMRPASPSVITINIHGMDIPFERRIFEKGGHQELVYYAGMLSGQPLPFRLGWGDLPGAAADSGRPEAPGLRSLERLKQAFALRQSLAGTKQFVRISTELKGQTAAAAEGLLREFLHHWLRPAQGQASPQS